MSLNLTTLLRENARENPDNIAIHIGGHDFTYGALDWSARSFGAGLKGLGVERGQRVALMLPNVPHFTMAYFGSHYAAAPVVPLNVLLKADEIAYHLEDSSAEAFVVWGGFYEQARAGFEKVPGCKHLIVAMPPEGMDVGDAHVMNGMMVSSPPIEEMPDTMPDDTAVILYTSGTTGRPKGAELTHFNMFYNADYVATKLLPSGPGSVALAVLPLFHSFGQTVIQNAMLHAGGKVVLLARFDATDALATIQEQKVTLFAGVPTMYFALLNHPEADGYDLSSLEHCVSGGAPMPVEVMRAFDEKYGVNILEGYGLSETSPVASFNTLDRPKKAGSIGIPIQGVEFRLEDESGVVIEKAGEPGEICIKGHNVMRGYLGKPDATAEAIRDGWFHSGDIATRDEDGFYFIVDRKKDMIIRGGYNVYPREIEEILYAYPGVAEAAVIGVPHERHGEEVKAVVAFKPDHSGTAEEVIAFCKERLAAYKYPRIVEFLPELPKGPTGKILKRELR